MASLRVREIDTAIAQYQIDQRRCPRTSARAGRGQIHQARRSASIRGSGASGSRAPTSDTRVGFRRTRRHLRHRRRHQERALTRPAGASSRITIPISAGEGERSEEQRRPARQREQCQIKTHAQRTARVKDRRHLTAEPAETVPNQDARAAIARVKDRRQPTATPAETVPNQDGTTAREAALSPGPARVGWAASRRRSQAEWPRARRLACQQTSAQPSAPRPDHPPRRPRSPVPPIRKRLSRREACARTIEPKHVSRASFLGTDRSRPPPRRGKRPPVPRAGNSGARWTLRESDQPVGTPSRSGVDRPLPRSRAEDTARGPRGAGLRAAELSEASASAAGRRSV